MKYSILLIIAFSLFSVTIYAHTDNPPSNNPSNHAYTYSQTKHTQNVTLIPQKTSQPSLNPNLDQSAYSIACSKNIAGKAREDRCLDYALALGNALATIRVPSLAFLVGETARTPGGPIKAHVFVSFWVNEYGRQVHYVVDNVATRPITPLFTNDPVQWYYQLAQVPTGARRQCGLHLIATFALPPQSPVDLKTVAILQRKNRIFNTGVPGNTEAYHRDLSWGANQ